MFWGILDPFLNIKWNQNPLKIIFPYHQNNFQVKISFFSKSDGGNTWWPNSSKNFDLWSTQKCTLSGDVPKVDKEIGRNLRDEMDEIDYIIYA